MNPLKVLLVDDEALARQRLRSLLAEPGPCAVQVQGEAGDAVTALQALAAQPVDLVLLDIHMPGLDGLQLAQQLRGLAQPPALVFVTAHGEYALAAFDVQAVDYLTKPVRLARLHEALHRASQWLQARAATAAPEAPTLVVQERGRVIRLRLDELLYLKAELKYVTVRTATRSYLLDDSLNELAQRLGTGFLRVHRNALVARSAVRALAERVGEGEDGWAVHIPAVDEWVSVSRRQLSAVREALAQA
jgi:two-component system, LytTR family, response regulator AlgR